MAKCASCGRIIFGGLKDGGKRFCNARCRAGGQIFAAASVLPAEVVDGLATQIHAGSCPKCKGPGPVDIHVSHRVWSALFLTRWSSSPQISCRRCGLKSQAGNLLFSSLFGWWGIPWGLIFTPVQISRNIGAMLWPPKAANPSEQLKRVARLQLATHVKP